MTKTYTHEIAKREGDVITIDSLTIPLVLRQRGRTTTAWLLRGDAKHKGTARCHPDDTFDQVTGENLAIARALVNAGKAVESARLQAIEAQCQRERAVADLLHVITEKMVQTYVGVTTDKAEQVARARSTLGDQHVTECALCQSLLEASRKEQQPQDDEGIGRQESWNAYINLSRSQDQKHKPWWKFWA